MPPRRSAAHAMAYVTAPDLDTARSIAQTVVGRRLAACANLWPIESMYWWRGTLENAREVVIVFKTRRALLWKLIATVRENHPHEVPYFVSFACVAPSRSAAVSMAVTGPYPHMEMSSCATRAEKPFASNARTFSIAFAS